MKEWTLIHSDTSPDGQGVIYAENVATLTEGEIARRSGMELCASCGAKAISPYYSAGGYGVLLFTSTGTIESVAL